MYLILILATGTPPPRRHLPPRRLPADHGPHLGVGQPRVGRAERRRRFLRGLQGHLRTGGRLRAVLAPRAHLPDGERGEIGETTTADGGI